MEDKLIMCNRCTSDLCYEIENEGIKQWFCLGCGHHSNSTRHKDSINYEEIEELLPNLYKDLRYIDDDGYIWYPTTINLPEKGMIFADGTSISNWRWAAVLASTSEPGRMDMATLNHFDEKDFMECMDYINYFNN